MELFKNRVRIITGDITGLSVEGIVNAANSSLLGGGGVDGAIHSAAGPSLLEECRKIRETRWPAGLPTGQAVITGAGRLPCRHVIHTVGPVWRGGHKGEEQLLKDAYTSSLALAAEQRLKSLAIPAISTGVYGYPPELAAPVVYDVLKAFTAAHPLPEQIILVFFSPRGRDIFTENIPREEY